MKMSKAMSSSFGALLLLLAATTAQAKGKEKEQVNPCITVAQCTPAGVKKAYTDLGNATVQTSILYDNAGKPMGCRVLKQRPDSPMKDVFGTLSICRK